MEIEITWKIFKQHKKNVSINKISEQVHVGHKAKHVSLGC